MPQDAFTLRKISIELNKILLGGKVNKITMPTADEVVMNIYSAGKNYKMVLSVNVATSRISLTETFKENPLSAYNFCMLLRKHLLNSTLQKIEQVGFDRVIALTFLTEEFFGLSTKVLYAEIMGKYSNLILTEKGIILGACKTASLEEMTKRPVLTGMKYLDAPKQDKVSPFDDEIFSVLNSYSGENFSQYLFNTVSGLSKQTADEIVFRHFNGLEIPILTNKQIDEFVNFLRSFILQPTYNPCVLFINDTPIDFYVFDYQTLNGKYISFENLLLAQESLYSNKEKSKNFKDLKAKLLSVINTEVKKFKKRLEIISLKERDCSHLESDKIKGELLISNAYRLKRSEEVVLENYYDDYKPIKITLDKNLSITENAERYYKKYNKQKRTLEAIIPQKEDVLNELKYTESLIKTIDLAVEIEELKNVEAELIATGLIKIKDNKLKKKKEVVANYYEYLIDGVTVKIGKNNTANDELVKNARGKDVWMHAKNYHSSHGIIEVREKPITEKIIKITAEIIGYYSGGRKGNKIEIDYTEKKNVKKPPKSKVGFVIYSENKSIIIDPEKHEEFLKSK